MAKFLRVTGKKVYEDGMIPNRVSDLGSGCYCMLAIAVDGGYESIVLSILHQPAYRKSVLLATAGGKGNEGLVRIHLERAQITKFWDCSPYLSRGYPPPLASPLARPPGRPPGRSPEFTFDGSDIRWP